jgi:hypothetical protein
MWDWLKWNGAVLQAAASLVGTLIGLVTIPVLIATWRAAHHAARASADQATAARELTEVSRAQQWAAERAATAAEAQVSSADANAALARQQLAALQESADAERAHNELIRQQTLAALRPVLRFGVRYSSGGQLSWTILENESGALALDVSAFNGTPQEPGRVIDVSNTTLPPGASSSIDGIEWDEEFSGGGRVSYPNPISLFARYRSSDGRWFRTVVADYRPSSSRRQIFEEE